MRDKIIDFSDAAQKGLFLSYCRTLDGQFKVSIAKYRKRRSLAQNDYYWAVVIDLFGDWIREQGWEINSRPMTNDDAHEFLKDSFLRIDIVEPRTGTIIGQRTRSTSELDTKEFMEYIDQCAQLLAEKCEIAVPPPTPWYVREATPVPQEPPTHY